MLLFFVGISSCLYAQDFSNYLVFRGSLVSQERNKPLSNLIVYNKSLKVGVFTDTSGSFSVYYNVGDTLVCSGLAYQSKIYITTDSSSRKIITIPLTKKNILLKEKIIYPWPSKEQFKTEFLELKIVDPQLEALKKHLDSKLLYNKWRAYPILHDAESNYKNYMRHKLMYR
jgi:hypothetical protein